MEAPIPFDPSRCNAEPLPSIFGRVLVPHCAVPAPPRPIREVGTRLLDLAPAHRGIPGPRGPRGFVSCTWQGRVVGGAGNVWRVLLYPRGPRCAPDEPAVSVTIIGIPSSSTDPAPVGRWIGPVHGHDERSTLCGSSTGSAGSAGSDGGDVPSGSYNDSGCHATAYYWSIPLGTKLARTDVGGIPARASLTVPGVATITIYDFDGGAAHAGRRVRCFNIFGSIVGPLGAWITVDWIDGCYFANGEDC